jgi:putative hemolysin
MGPTLKAAPPELDVDEADAVCQHLLVREAKAGQVVGCTRILTDDNAARLGRSYSNGELDLGPVTSAAAHDFEVGPTCIAAEFRQGSAIAVLWSGLAGCIRIHGFDYLFVCAGILLGDRDLQAAAIMNRPRRRALVPEPLSLTPRVPLLTTEVRDAVLDAQLPGLLRAYVRLRAKACGGSCRDPDFQVADLLMLLKAAELGRSYSRHVRNRAPGI